MMSEFELDIDSPYDDPPKEKLERKPEAVEYNNYKIKYKHYGKIIEKMINKALEYPEGEEKDILIEVIATHMKKNYLTWNKDSVSDNQIFDDLEELSEGRLKIDRDKIKLAESKEIISKIKKKRNSRKNNNKNNNKSQ